MSTSKTLIIVESPAKGQKIQEYLGNDYIVMASKGHITDLAKGGKHGLGVDVENNFKPKYVLSDDRIDILDALLAAAKKVDRILVASDPDREGEAIAWHLADRLTDTGKPIKRMVFNKIKKDAIKKSLKEVRDIDMNLFHSQEARRILDRLVGFTASPFLMNFFGPKLSAGRVQSVVTRMIIDREREIENFIPEDFWTINVNLVSNNHESFVAKFNGKLTSLKDAELTKNKLNNNDYIISEVLSEEERKSPSAPLVTSTLQRIMSKQYGFNAERTMKAAQSLYENGYISYIRTDSVRVNDEDINSARDWLSSHNYEIPKKPNIFKNKDAVQDAHECIHPTDINLIPNENYAILDEDEKQVYKMVWDCFLASQMTPAVYDTLTVYAHPSNDSSIKVKAFGKSLKYDGFMKILGITDDNKIDIPNLSVGETVYLAKKNPIKMEKKSTQPPPRFSEDKLIKELVNKNIGRPATYAELLSKITNRNYVEKKGNVYHATVLGKQITDVLNKFFSFMDYNYTADMESKLDEIENGKLNHIDMLKKFYPNYKQELDRAYMDNGGSLCNKCGSPMTIRTSKENNKFLACSHYPQCKNTQSL